MQRIDALVRESWEQASIIILTHNVQQAGRLSDNRVVTMAGEERIGRPVEQNENDQVFGDPRDPCTEAYVTGRIGQDERNQHAS